MELFEVLNCYCNRNSGAVTKDDKRRYSYMLRRLFSAKFPIQCNMVNHLNSDPLVDAEVIALLAMRFNGLPPFLKVRVDQKKKKDSIRKFYEDDVLNKYMEINECGIREVEQAYEIDKKSVDYALKLIKETFFNEKESIIKQKYTKEETEENNKVTCCRILCVHIFVDKFTRIEYTLNDSGLRLKEDQVYETKEELLKSL